LSVPCPVVASQGLVGCGSKNPAGPSRIVNYQLVALRTACPVGCHTGLVHRLVDTRLACAGCAAALQHHGDPITCRRLAGPSRC
jgi:hypothetical protein